MEASLVKWFTMFINVSSQGMRFDFLSWFRVLKVKLSIVSVIQIELSILNFFEAGKIMYEVVCRV